MPMKLCAVILSDHLLAGDVVCMFLLLICWVQNITWSTFLGNPTLCFLCFLPCSVKHGSYVQKHFCVQVDPRFSLWVQGLGFHNTNCSFSRHSIYTQGSILKTCDFGFKLPSSSSSRGHSEKFNTPRKHITVLSWGDTRRVCNKIACGPIKKNSFFFLPTVLMNLWSSDRKSSFFLGYRMCYEGQCSSRRIQKGKRFIFPFLGTPNKRTHKTYCFVGGSK